MGMPELIPANIYMPSDLLKPIFLLKAKYFQDKNHTSS